MLNFELLRRWRNFELWIFDLFFFSIIRNSQIKIQEFNIAAEPQQFKTQNSKFKTSIPPFLPATR